MKVERMVFTDLLDVTMSEEELKHYVDKFGKLDVQILVSGDYRPNAIGYIEKEGFKKSIAFYKKYYNSNDLSFKVRMRGEGL